MKTVLNIVLNHAIQDARVLKSAMAARDAGWRAAVIGFSKTKETEIHDVDGVEVILTPNARWILEAGGTWERDVEQRDMERFVEVTAELFAPHAERLDADLIHSHDMYGLGAGAYLVRELARRAMTPAWIHDAHEYTRGATNISRNLQHQAMKQHHRFIREPDGLITVSDMIADNLVAEDSLEIRPTVVLNAPRKNTGRSDDDIRSSIGLGDDVPLIVYSGSIASKQRGVATLIEAMADMPDVHVAVICNRQVAFDQLRDIAAAKGVADRLHQHDYVPIDEVTNFLRTATLGCHPMLHFGNGEVAMPNKLFEYIHSGIPLLVSDVKSMAAFVRSHEIGEVFIAEDAESLAEQAMRIICNRNDYATNITEELIDTHSWETQAPKILHMYDEAMARSAPSTEGHMRVLHGVTGAAGQPWQASRALRAIGVDADAIRVFAEKTKANFRVDHVFDHRMKADAHLSFARLAPRYDVFHFYARSFLAKRPSYIYPSAQDLLLLRAAGKAVVFNFRGSEARIPSLFREKCPYHWLPETANDEERELENVQREFIDFVQAIGCKPVVIDPEVQTYVPGAEIIPRAIDLDAWAYSDPPDNATPRILHAPTNREIKGTDIILSALEALKSEGVKFDLELVEGMTHAEARDAYARSDIIIDQVRGGWHGVLALEAMALGRPVMAYIRDDLVSHFPDPSPIALTRPETLKDDIKRLLANADERRALARRGREYVERVHDSKKIAKSYKVLYERILKEPPAGDLLKATPFLLRQLDTYQLEAACIAQITRKTDAGTLMELLENLESGQTLVVPASAPGHKRYHAALDRVHARFENREEQFRAAIERQRAAKNKLRNAYESARAAKARLQKRNEELIALLANGNKDLASQFAQLQRAHKRGGVRAIAGAIGRKIRWF